MEIGLDTEMKTYCGGLGILAGDTLKSAADLGLNMVGVSLLYKQGWFKQVLDLEKGQIELPDTWDYEKKLKLHPKNFLIEIAGEMVTVQIWEYTLCGVTGHQNPVFFLDTDLPENSEIARKLSQVLYSTDLDIWLRQEVLLGAGGLKALEILGYPSFENYHLNESHAMPLVLALKKHFKTWEETRKRLCFTTHTPLRGAHQVAQKDILEKYIPSELLLEIPAELWEEDKINFTTVCVFASKFSNGVAKRHMEVTQEMYPQYKIDYVTNGIHHITWASKYQAELFDKYLGNWKEEPANLRLAFRIPDEELLESHKNSKLDLINEINTFQPTKLNRVLPDFKENVFTIGFARRAVPYKRANLIFSQLERLSKIASRFGGLQIVFSGKTGPNDAEGKETIKQILEICGNSNDILNVAYLENYTMGLSGKLVSGVDIWLNNPLPPLEASGTSGMKASLNGVPNFSILDGWWPEGWVEDMTGWSIGGDLCVGDHCRLIEIEDLYTKLENVILPKYLDKAKWVQIQKNCIGINGDYFHTKRMLQEYIIKGYIM